MATLTPAEKRSGWRTLRLTLRGLYHGHSRRAVQFRLAVIVVDFALIAFFIAAPFLRDGPSFLLIDYAVASVLVADMTARSLASRNMLAWLKRPIVWLDLFVLATLLAPLWLYNLAFLRVLRIWTLFHSEFFWNTIGRRYDDTRWEEVLKAAATLFTVIFVITGFVYTIYVGKDAGVEGYVDALYFTVATLTTTGFGDITLPGTMGKLLSVVTMLAGITLFVRFAQALFKPNKVRFHCPTCGLLKHDPDAVHCKACGVVLNIPNDEP